MSTRLPMTASRGTPRVRPYRLARGVPPRDGPVQHHRKSRAHTRLQIWHERHRVPVRNPIDIARKPSLGRSRLRRGLVRRRRSDAVPGWTCRCSGRSRHFRIPEALATPVTRRGEHDSCERHDSDVAAGSQRSQEGGSVANECEHIRVSRTATNAGTLMSRPVLSGAGQRSVTVLAACPHKAGTEKSTQLT